MAKFNKKIKKAACTYDYLRRKQATSNSINNSKVNSTATDTLTVKVNMSYHPFWIGKTQPNYMDNPTNWNKKELMYRLYINININERSKKMEKTKNNLLIGKVDEVLYKIEKIEEELDYLNRATFEESTARLD